MREFAGALVAPRAHAFRGMDAVGLTADHATRIFFRPCCDAHVVPRVITVPHHLQVAESVVERIVVFVVDELIRAQRAPEMLFHHVAVLIRPLARLADFDFVVRARASIVRSACAERLLSRLVRPRQVLTSLVTGPFSPPLSQMLWDASRVTLETSIFVVPQGRQLPASAFTQAIFNGLELWHLGVSLA